MHNEDMPATSTSANMDHVLIVDDDAAIRDLLALHLSRQGFRVSTAAHGGDLWRVLGVSPVDLIVLDLMLPGEDGMSLFRTLRAGEHRTIPVIMLTALGDDVDRIIGLEQGADDYLGKPFAVRELIARIRSVLRRARMTPPGQSSPAQARYAQFGDWVLDSVERRMVHRDGVVALLSSAEYALLAFLVARPQRIVTRDQLLIQMSGREADAFDRSIDLRVSRLRKRLGDVAKEPTYIKTVRHEGYVLTQAVTWHATSPLSPMSPMS